MFIVREWDGFGAPYRAAQFCTAATKPFKVLKQLAVRNTTHGVHTVMVDEHGDHSATVTIGNAADLYDKLRSSDLCEFADKLRGTHTETVDPFDLMSYTLMTVVVSFNSHFKL